MTVVIFQCDNKTCEHLFTKDSAEHEQYKCPVCSKGQLQLKKKAEL